MPKPLQAQNKEYHFALGLTQKELVCAFTARASGNMSLSYGESAGVIDNRRNFLNNFNISLESLVCAKQTHSAKIKYVKLEHQGSGALSSASAIADTDAFITDRKNIPLAIFTADCPAVFIYDPGKPAIGLVHCGWRSSNENILKETLGLMQREFYSRMQDIRVSFGPAIRSCCYEVGQELEDFFPQDLIKRNRHYYLDLPGLNKKQALALGVKEENIFDCGICTVCQNNDFFSYRKEGKASGRMMSLAMLR